MAKTQTRSTIPIGQRIREGVAYMMGRNAVMNNMPYAKMKDKIDEADKILAHIIQLATNRAVQDIDNWIASLQAAEDPWFPQRVQLYDLYYALKKDGHLRMLRRQLYKYATGGKFQIVDKDTKEVDKDLTALFQKQWWKLLRKQWVDQFFEGYRLLQFTELNPTEGKINFELVPPKHVHPEAGFWTVWQSDLDGTHYRDDPQAMLWLMEIGDRYDMGELDPCAPYILFKKNAMQSWAEFGERFGIPLAKGKVNASDKKAVDRMVSFLADMGGNKYAVIDHAEDITFEAQSGTDAFDVFDKLIERCNSEMSKMVLLSVMSNDVGKNGSRAQSQTHNIHSDEVKEELRQDVESLCDEQVLPKLAEHGFNVKNKVGQFIQDKAVSKDDNLIDQWLVSTFEMGKKGIEHFKEKYNVPIEDYKKNPEPVEPEPGEGGEDPADPAAVTAKKEALKKLMNVATGKYSILELHSELAELYAHKHDH